MTARAEAPGLAGAFRVQGRVLHALMMREMHTRFRRGGFGPLWLFLEPLLLAVCIGVIKVGVGRWDQQGMDPFVFGVIGYVPYFGFRAIIGRAASAVPANMALMYHRPVRLIDIVTARNLLEAAAVTGVITLILGAVAWLTGTMPWSISTLILGMVLLLLFAHGLAMLAVAGCAVSDAFDRLLHPMVYLSLPVSGAMFALHWMQPAWREMLLWNPQVHFHEMVRHGMFGPMLPTYHDPVYMLGAVLVVNALGLLALRAVRRRLEFEV